MRLLDLQRMEKGLNQAIKNFIEDLSIKEKQLPFGEARNNIKGIKRDLLVQYRSFIVEPIYNGEVFITEENLEDLISHLEDLKSALSHHSRGGDFTYLYAIGVIDIMVTALQELLNAKKG